MCYQLIKKVKEIARLQREEFDTIYQTVKVCVKTNICLVLFIILTVSVVIVLLVTLRNKPDHQQVSLPQIFLDSSDCLVF